MTDHKTILAYAEEIDWALVPVYVTLSFLVAWIGLLSVLFFQSEGVTAAEMAAYAKGVQVLMIVLILFPFAAPLLRLAGRRWWRA